MTFEIFISILVLSATATSIAIDIIKELLDKFNKTYNSVILAAISAFIVGFAEIFVYYIMKDLSIVPITVLYAICMGVLNAVSSMVGYDTVKKFLLSIVGKTS